MYFINRRTKHPIKLPVGQGSISIGTKGLSEGEYDIWVKKDRQINWDAFNGSFTGYGQDHLGLYPYGNWARVFYYLGNDQGFINWSVKRKIEDFHWLPTEHAVVDLSKADITRMLVHTKSHNIRILVGDKIRDFFLSGNLENIYIEKGSYTPPYLYFTPHFPLKESLPYQLPIFNVFKDLTSVDISTAPVGRAFDCKSLLQFHNLMALNLAGNIINLEALSELTQLESMELRYVPDLSNMPKLASWVNLKSFIGYNVEESKGKMLRAELNKLLKEREMDYSSVTKLRKAIWFTTEYGIPFSNWNSKNSKIATKAYKACLKQINKSQTENQVKDEIICFVEAINQLDNIETSERDDVWIAVTQLIESFALEISQTTVQRWFDEIRDF